MTQPIDLDAIEKRYSTALDARPSKGVQIGDKAWTALTDSVADVPDLIAALRAAKVSTLQEARLELSRMMATFPMGGRHTRASWAVAWLDVMIKRAEERASP